MEFKEKVRGLLEQGLEEHPSLFLIDFSIGSDDKISVIIDGDEGVTLQDCIDVSRSIEHNLDREERDFSLEVASAGVSTPLKLPRQYRKNIGRKLEVETHTQEKFTGEIVDATEEYVELYWKAREPKKIGKGKETVEKRTQLAYADIKKAVVQVVF